jgi:hypothetical protein
MLMKKSSNFREGRWEAEEHERFLKACYDHGEDWDKVEKLKLKHFFKNKYAFIDRRGNSYQKYCTNKVSRSKIHN